MKITDVKIFAAHQFVYVKIVTDEGLHGLGEASLSGRPLAVVETLNHLKPLLLGQDATRIEHIWQDIFRGTFWRGGPVLQSALAGVDIARWDLAGKALGYPYAPLSCRPNMRCKRSSAPRQTCSGIW
jgi:mannonate dehydratase